VALTEQRWHVCCKPSRMLFMFKSTVVWISFALYFLVPNYLHILFCVYLSFILFMLCEPRVGSGYSNQIKNTFI